MREKWRDEGGETLVEVMASVLIMALSVLLLFSAAVASVRINKSAKDMDKEFYDALYKAEARSEKVPESIFPSVSSEVTVKQTSPGPAASPPKKVEVDFYGGEGALSYSYRDLP